MYSLRKKQLKQSICGQTKRKLTYYLYEATFLYDLVMFLLKVLLHTMVFQEKSHFPTTSSLYVLSCLGQDNSEFPSHHHTKHQSFALTPLLKLPKTRCLKIYS